MVFDKHLENQIFFGDSNCGVNKHLEMSIVVLTNIWRIKFFLLKKYTHVALCVVTVLFVWPLGESSGVRGLSFCFFFFANRNLPLVCIHFWLLCFFFIILQN